MKITKDGFAIEEMIYPKQKGIFCKICDEGGFGRLFRVAYKTNKTKYGCYKCTIDFLEKSFINDSDTNKMIQDAINYLRV